MISLFAVLLYFLLVLYERCSINSLLLLHQHHRVDAAVLQLAAMGLVEPTFFI